MVAARAAAGWAARRPLGSLETEIGPRLVFRTEAPPTAPAFFAWWLRLEGEHSPGRHFSRRVELTGRVTTVDLELPRGRYQVTARWELSDAFGFSRLAARKVWTTVVTVPPGVRGFTPPPPPPTRPGPWRPRRAGQRSGDPFDVRPYTAGDDLRRLHWPLYAHSDTLFVRTAEPSPPPTGHQFFVLDTDGPTDDDLDPRLETLAAWIATLDAQGTGWTVVVPAEDLRWGPGDSVREGLAALVPSPLPDRPVDSTWPDTVTVLTAPGPGLDRLAARLSASRRRFHPIVVPPPAQPSAAPRPWWRRR